MIKYLILCAAFLLFSFVKPAYANDFYNSFVESVDQANSQAHITLADGVYISSAGDSTMVWDLTGGNRATIAFNYANRTLQSGSIAFFEPLQVEVRAASGLCSIFTVRKLSFQVGGAIDPDNSDFRLTAPTPTCNYSKNALLLEQHFGLTNDSGRFFHGRVFSAGDGFRKCKNKQCKQTAAGQPVTKVVFFSKLMPDGTLDAVSVSLRKNATLRLPNAGGWIQISDGTRAKVAQLTYDLISDKGSAFINEITINVRTGSINTGDNVINLEDGSKVVFASIDIEQQPGLTLVKDGDISGALGSQSVVILTSAGRKKSTLIFNKGEVALRHVVMSFAPGANSMKAQYATIKGDIRDAQLFFSDRNNLNLSNVNFQVDLKCRDAEAECYGIDWNSNGGVNAIGTITPFQAAIIGGSWAIDTQNSLRLASGTLHAPILTLDTSAAFFPISGGIDRLELQLSSQDIRLNANSTVTAAAVKFVSDNLILNPDDAYPVGNLTLDGSIKAAVFGDLDSLGLLNANLHLEAARAVADSVRISEGSIAANVSLRDSARNSGSASLAVSNLRAYENELSANVRLSIDSFQSAIELPGSDTSGEEGGDLGKIKADVHIRQVSLTATLAQPIVFDGKLILKNGKVDVPAMRDVPLDVNIGIPNQELIYVNVNAKPPVGGGFNVCNPKVVLDGGSYLIKGKSDLAVTGGAVSLGLRDFVLLKDIGMSSEDRNCKYVGGLICGAIGAIAGPTVAVAAAYMCGSEIDKAEHNASEKINDGVKGQVAGFKYVLGQ